MARFLVSDIFLHRQHFQLNFSPHKNHKNVYDCPPTCTIFATYMQKMPFSLKFLHLAEFSGEDYFFYFAERGTDRVLHPLFPAIGPGKHLRAGLFGIHLSWLGLTYSN